MANTSVSKVSVTVTFQKPGTRPPLFIAGTFSDPPWEPQEMHPTTDDGGEYIFTKSIHLSPGAQVQYKLRVGLGDWWILNEVTRYPPTNNNVAVFDDSGNTNNLLTAPPLQEAPIQHTKSDTPAAPAPEVAPKPKGISRVQELDKQRQSSTPIEQVAATAAEVADTAEKLDEDEAIEEKQNGAEDETPPLLAHECLGSVGSSPSDVSPLGRSEQRRSHGSVDYDIDKYDLNDPTLEKWPSDRNSIIEALRKVETGLTEDPTCFVGSPVSPGAGDPRKASIVEDQGALSTSTESGSPGSGKKLDVPRKTSVVSHKSRNSQASLAAIAEEGAKERAGGGSEGKTETPALRPPSSVVHVPSHGITPAPDSAKGLSSDEDEAVVMQGSEAKIKTKAAENDKAQGPNTNELPPEESQARSLVNVRDTNEVSTSSPGVPPRSQSPGIQVQPPDEMDELEDADEAGATGGLVTSSDQFDETSAERLVSRQVGERNGPTDRPVTPQSVFSTKGAGGGNWIRNFFRVVFVDWIGAFINRLWRGKWR
ncbi:hypothetical protein SODALDRAFT_320235 [Sodiomyces alkalinus F11]|uniref:AMP-activated protein kinase glycogen-binding domain-containing protein n=1 Tax=Sodiomyces alkalinus (strain CBS 110278 / VKM F-3762 / F11) TaxID=1314773 RepID=A0A3N2PML0_SODAK|nr:hypothetical protein SODALDRAFT_320235 [Sodiomyces alkalinus F11]ROT35709.1 hypothetical protein SODALDRAFT_320235 [Sodiomyces alkalinus F11]